MSDYNKAPYYDDINTAGQDGLSPAEKFQRILFKPGSAVQARELTQIQSLLQSQISRMGDHFFKEGSLILPGNITHDNNLEYITVAKDPAKQDSYYTSYIDDTIYEYGGVSVTIENPITAVVKNVKYNSVTNEYWFYISYTSANPDRELSTHFKVGDVIKPLADASEELTVKDNNIINIDASTTRINKAAISSISAGIFYINKMFVPVNTHTFISNDAFESHSSDPAAGLMNYSIGLDIKEEVIDIRSDNSLGDNSLGTNNSRAEGADRLKVTATLISTPDATIPESNFIELIRIVDNKIIKKVDRTVYNILSEELARRTFDESGDYTIQPFTLDIKDTVDGINFPATLGKSKAYVKGFEIETINSTNIKIPTVSASDATNILLNADNNQFIIIDQLRGAYQPGKEVDVCIDDGNVIIGTVKISHIVSYKEHTGGNAEYKLYVYDYKPNTNSSVSLSNTSLNFSLRQVINRNSTVVAETCIFTTNVISFHVVATKSSNIFELKSEGISLLQTAVNDFTPKDGKASFYVMEHITGTINVENNTTAFANENDRTIEFTSVNNIFDASKLNAVIFNTGLVISEDTSDTDSNTIQEQTPGFITDADIQLGYIEKVAGVNNKIRLNLTKLALSYLYIGSDLATIVIPTKVEVSKGFYKTKTLLEASWSLNKSDINIDNGNDFVISPSLDPISDVYTLISIKNADNDLDDTEYKDNFKVTNGYTDYYYTPSKLIFTGTDITNLPSSLTITYEYFSHSSQGLFFSRESYDPSIRNLPTYFSVKYNKEINVGNIIDFRTRSDNAGELGRVTLETNSLIEINTAIARNRKDIITLDVNGNFNVITGIPSDTPKFRETPSNALKLYELSIPANALKASDITIKRMNNRRYTMRDIGKIEKRVNRLEEYTTLSLLESSAMNAEINRFKSGFFVDAFKDHFKGDTAYPNYQCEVDPEIGFLKASSTRKNFNLIWEDHPGGVLTNNIFVENELSAADKATFNIKKSGDLLTLNYTEVNELSTPLDATNFINVNPFNVFDFTGTLVLSPATDDWKDTDRRPDVIFEQPGLYDAMLANINMDSIGTVWNDWETEWVGVTGLGEDGLPAWIGNSLTTTTTQGQTISGIQTTLGETTELVDMGDRVVSVNLAPFMRPRLISFKGTGLKPNTRLLATFDDTDVTRFCRMESIFIDHNISGNYPDAQMSQNYGADWASVEYNLTADHHPVQNQIGLTSDDAGSIIGSFWLPNLDNINFKTGTREFRLTDGLQSTGSSFFVNRDLETSTASVDYQATGLIESLENTTLSTRMPVITTHEVFDSRELITTDVRYKDPLAQSFVLNRSEYPEGFFATSIDLYFKRKDSNIPITLQIREMRDGTPTQKVLGFSEVLLKPQDVNEIPHDRLLDENETPQTIEQLKTKFKFIAPVYLAPGIEYCFVLMANSDNYEVWYHTVGEKSLVTGELSTQQLWGGSMFKSQNASTWESESYSDIPFALNRAQFDISKPGKLNLRNQSLSLIRLHHNPITIPATTTDTHYDITINHDNHGFITGDKVTLSGVTFAAGFNVSELNKEHTIYSIVNNNDYIIRIAASEREGADLNDSSATWVLMKVGGNNVFTTHSIDYSTFCLNVTQKESNDTEISWDSVHRKKQGSNPAFTIDKLIPLNPNVSVNFDETLSVNFDDTETQARFTATLKSNSDLVSPVIDLDRTSVIAVENIIGNTTHESLATYVSKEITLNNMSSGINLFMDVFSPNNTKVKMFYMLDDQPWVEFIDTINNNNKLEEIQLIHKASNTVDLLTGHYPLFNRFRIKIEMYSSLSAIIPVVRNLRVIASEDYFTE